jgi:hypothetical protein
MPERLSKGARINLEKCLAELDREILFIDSCFKASGITREEVAVKVTDPKCNSGLYATWKELKAYEHSRDTLLKYFPQLKSKKR